MYPRLNEIIIVILLFCLLQKCKVLAVYSANCCLIFLFIIFSITHNQTHIKHVRIYNVCMYLYFISSQQYIFIFCHVIRASLLTSSIKISSRIKSSQECKPTNSRTPAIFGRVLQCESCGHNPALNLNFNIPSDHIVYSLLLTLELRLWRFCINIYHSCV